MKIKCERCEQEKEHSEFVDFYKNPIDGVCNECKAKPEELKAPEELNEEEKLKALL